MKSVLVDTNIWIEHLRRDNKRLSALLEGDSVLFHSLVWGELACGEFKNREKILNYYYILPSSDEADIHELITLINQQKLYGKGLGIVDMHLLAACKLSNALLWTNDKALKASAKKLKVSYI
jgi:predicted nucleic acid-binding protein